MEIFLKNILIPSANNRNKETIRRGRIYKENTSEYLEFKNIIRTVCVNNGFIPIPKPNKKNKSFRNVSMGLIIYFEKGGRSDLANNCKCLEDSLEGYFYDNDIQIKQYHELKIIDYAGFNGFKVECLEIKGEKNES